MIGALKGTVFSKTKNPIILFTGGVGYAVHVTDHLLDEMVPEKNVFLFIHSHIREDAFDLFGFPTKEELHLFELLLTVSGIGPKTALAVVNKGVRHVEEAIRSSDVDFFTTIPRLGKKNAQKIIIELKSKLGSISDLDLTESQSTETKELLEVLSSMGFVRNEALRAIRALPRDVKTLQEKIRFCLQTLGKSV
jgi:Holliday junction DNA helicase RuvA